MFCPKCGKMNPDDREKCSGCGAVLHEEEPRNAKKKKSPVGKIIAIIAALAVAAGGTAVAVTSCDGQAEAAVFAEACYILVK